MQDEEDILAGLVNEDLVKSDDDDAVESGDEEAGAGGAGADVPVISFADSSDDEDGSGDEEEGEKGDDEFSRFEKNSGALAQSIGDEYQRFKEQVNNKRREGIERSQLLAKSIRLREKGYPPSRELSEGDTVQALRMEVFSQQTRMRDDQSLVFMKKALVSGASALEIANNFFKNPFGINLSGYSGDVDLELSTDVYDDTLLDLREKYASGSAIPPEAKLGFLLVSTGVSTHLGNSQGKMASKAIKAGLKMVGAAGSESGKMNPPSDSESDSDSDSDVSV